MTTNNALNAPIPFSLANGGTGANITASNGGIVYSNASTFAVLAGTATAGQLLTSGASTTPVWSTSTYPLTNAVSTLLYASSANVMAALATANSAVLVTNSTGVPAYSGTMTNGQLIIGSTGGTPTAATITAGTGITVTNGAHTITIAATQEGNWVDQNSSTANLAAGTNYVCDNGASLITFTLPVSPTLGDTFKIVGNSAGGWKVAQNASQIQWVGSSASTTGTSGFIASTLASDCVTITYTFGNIFQVYALQGNITVS